MTGMMARDFYEASPFLLLPLVALGLFVFAFVAVCIRAILLGRQGADEQARLALDDAPATGVSPGVSPGEEVGR